MTTSQHINIAVSIYSVYPNIEIINWEEDWKYISYESPETTSFNKVYDVVSNWKAYSIIASNRLNMFIYNLTNEDDNYTNEIEMLLNSLLNNLYSHNRNYRLLKIIDKWYYSISFDHYNSKMYDWTIIVFNLKVNHLSSLPYNYYIPHNYCQSHRRKEDYILEDTVISSLFRKPLKKGTRINRLIFSNITETEAFSDWKSFHLQVTTNTLTIFCEKIDKRIINFETLGRLWTGLILRLEDFWCWSNEGIWYLLQLVLNGDKTMKGRKLLFSKIEFTKLEMNCFLKNDLKLFNAFLKAARKLYKLIFENDDISELMNKENIRDWVIRNDKK